jgi:hypothetical protein
MSLFLKIQGVWCSWLSHALSMREVPGSIPVSSIFLRVRLEMGYFSVQMNVSMPVSSVLFMLPARVLRDEW